MTKNKTGFGNQIMKGGFWLMALEVSNQLLQFIKTFYAATILTPSDFGIVGFAFLIITFIDVISTTGMKEAIIQRQDDTRSYLSTVWVIEFGKGVVILLLSFLFAPQIARIVQPENPALTENVIRFIGCIYLIQCSTNIGAVYFEKDIQFKKFFLYQFSGTFIDVIASLLLVYYLENVWALFFGTLAGNSVRVIFSFLIAYRPKIDFSIAKAKELFRYGKWIFRGRIFTFLGLQLDSIIVSTFFKLYALGIYQMGFRIGSLPITQVANVMGRIVFPMLSKVQTDHEKVKEYFLTSINVLATGLAPIVILVFCYIPEFVTLFLGVKWIEIVPIVRVLILSGYVRIFATLLDYLFSALGSPKKSAAMQFTRFISFAIFVIPLSYFLGILGVALTGLVSLTIILIVYLRKAAISLHIKFNEVNRNLLQPTLFSCLIMILLFLLKNLFLENNFLNFFIMITLSVSVYIIAGLILTYYSRIKLFEKTISVLKSYKVKI